MEDGPAISVVMPVYNGMPFLPETLDCLLSQTESNFELVVVDDGSTDATPSILAEAARRDRRIRVVSLAHGGIVSALNAGLAAARAPLIARMDADDLCLPERLALQRQALEADSELGLVASQVAYGGDAAVNRGFALFVDWTNGLVDPRDIRLKRFVETPLIHPTVMFRRECVTRFGGYRDGDFPEDYELWLRWLDRGVRMAKLPRELVTWRERKDRLSRVHPRYSETAFYRCKAEYLARYLCEEAGPHRRVAVWGAGRTTRKRAAFLAEFGVTIAAFIDIDPRKVGQRIGGVPVWDKESLPDPGDTFVLAYVGNRGARDLISAHLQERGYREGRDYLLAA